MALVRRLLDVAFGADELFSLAVSLALPRVYQAARVGSAHRPCRWPCAAVPGLGQLHAAVIDVIRKAGYDRKTRARLRGVADARFGSLRTGSAGRFLEGGHPGDLGALLRRPVVLAVHDIGAAGDRAFVSGALLIRLASICGSVRGANRPAKLLVRLRMRRRVPAAGPAAAARPRDRGGAGHPPRPGPEPGVRRRRRPNGSRPCWRSSGRTGKAPCWLTEPRPALLVPDVSRNVAANRAPEPAARWSGRSAAPGPAGCGCWPPRRRSCSLAMVRPAAVGAAGYGVPTDGRPAADRPGRRLRRRDPAVRAASAISARAAVAVRAAVAGRAAEARAGWPNCARRSCWPPQRGYAWLRVWAETLGLLRPS